MDTETIRETTWNLCKKYDATQKRRCHIWLSNFITTALEEMFGWEIENLFRNEWQEEAALFCKKYGYAA